MNIKISDFAARYGISDRHARRLLSDNARTLDGHYEKNTKGTWIDQYAADFLHGLLRNPIEILPADFGPDVEQLQREITELKEENRQLSLNWAQAEQRANKGMAAVALLEAAESREKQLVEENKALISAKATWEQEKAFLLNDYDNLKAENGGLSAEKDKIEAKAKEDAEASQNRINELSEALQAEKNRKLTWKERLFGVKVN